MMGLRMRSRDGSLELSLLESGSMGVGLSSCAGCSGLGSSGALVELSDIRLLLLMDDRYGICLVRILSELGPLDHMIHHEHLVDYSVRANYSFRLSEEYQTWCYS